jgi:hypothetical protein
MRMHGSPIRSGGANDNEEENEGKGADEADNEKEGKREDDNHNKGEGKGSQNWKEYGKGNKDRYHNDISHATGNNEQTGC